MGLRCWSLGRALDVGAEERRVHAVLILLEEAVSADQVKAPDAVLAARFAAATRSLALAVESHRS